MSEDELSKLVQGAAAMAVVHPVIGTGYLRDVSALVAEVRRLQAECGQWRKLADEGVVSVPRIAEAKPC